MRKRVGCIFIAFCLLISVLPLSVAAKTPFQDVPTGAWYAAAVEYVYGEGLFSGTSASQFSPNAPMQRVQIAQVLANSTEGYRKAEHQGIPCFVDVPKDYWGSAPVHWAYQNSLIDGVGEYRFSPQSPLTRQQLAVILYRYAQRTGSDTSLAGSRYNTFSDKDQVASWAAEAMQWAVNRGIINGSNGKLNPKKTCTRAEVAQMLLNGKNVLTSHRLLSQELRPDPDPSQLLLYQVDSQLIMACIGYFGGTSPSSTNQLTTAHWQGFCSMWFENAYWAHGMNAAGIITPVKKGDVVSISAEECYFTKDCVDIAIQVMGGNPAQVLEKLNRYTPSKYSDYDQIRFSGNYLRWVTPHRGFDPATGYTVLSKSIQGDTVKITYKFKIDVLDAGAYWYKGEAVVAASDNDLGYKISTYRLTRA